MEGTEGMEGMEGLAVIGPVAGIIALVIAVFFVVCWWKIFTKAGQPGWAILIPFYNIYVMLKIAGKPGWWLVLFFVPLVNFVIMILMIVGIAQSFGKGTGFILGLIFLTIIFIPILAFGESKYVGATSTA
jgi:hypothetical protein